MPELLASAEVRAPAADRRVPGSSLADGSFWGNLTISLRTHTGNRTRAALAKIDGETTRPPARITYFSIETVS